MRGGRIRLHRWPPPRVAAALDRGARALAEAGAPRRCGYFVQISLDGDTERGGVDIGDPAAVDAICAQVADAEGLNLVGLMAIPPGGRRPRCGRSRALAAEHRRARGAGQPSLRATVVSRDVRRPGSGGATRFNVCVR